MDSQCKFGQFVCIATLIIWILSVAGKIMILINEQFT